MIEVIADVKQLVRDWNYAQNIDNTLAELCRMAGMDEEFKAAYAEYLKSGDGKPFSELARKAAAYFGIGIDDPEYIDDGVGDWE